MCSEFLDITRWEKAGNTQIPKIWKCWNCGADTGGQFGYRFFDYDNSTGYSRMMKGIYICPQCAAPVYFPDVRTDDYEPKSVPGNNVNSSDKNIDSLYTEMRECIGCGACTAAVMVGRKILMHVAVDFGAKPDLSFSAYVDYLYENHYVSQRASDWVDHIRKKGNEANHDIAIMDKKEATLLLQFVEMLLETNYEFPAALDEATQSPVEDERQDDGKEMG